MACDKLASHDIEIGCLEQFKMLAPSIYGLQIIDESLGYAVGVLISYDMYMADISTSS